MPRDYRKIVAWQKAHQLTIMVYQQTKAFPREELYGLTSQLRRACASGAANIVEGASRESKKEYLQFLYVARGSLNEADYFLLLAHDLGHLTDGDYAEARARVKESLSVLHGLIESVQKEGGVLGTCVALLTVGAAGIIARCLPSAAGWL